MRLLLVGKLYFSSRVRPRSLYTASSPVHVVSRVVISSDSATSTGVKPSLVFKVLSAPFSSKNLQVAASPARAAWCRAVQRRAGCAFTRSGLPSTRSRTVSKSNRCAAFKKSCCSEIEVRPIVDPVNGMIARPTLGWMWPTKPRQRGRTTLSEEPAPVDLAALGGTHARYLAGRARPSRKQRGRTPQSEEPPGQARLTLHMEA
mmetsp:Transcript_6999/g.17501  ORF Transcript_6999/g.17501 Transcript_6999/m.17501 type:complete len:203 (-) Transcript_6999:2-610(-)